MAACAAAPRVTICPPGPERPSLHFGQQLSRGIYPISVDFRAGGEIESPGISFNDYSGMQTVLHKLNASRRIETPAWVLNDNDLRAVVVRYMEFRAHLLGPQPGTELERLQRAQKRLDDRRPRLIASLDGLCREYMALKNENGDRARIKKLQEEIENLDTQLRFNENIAGKVLRVCHLYWRQGFNSVDTGSAVDCKPPHIRVLLMRLIQVWARIQNPAQVCNNSYKEIDVALAAQMVASGKNRKEVAAHFKVDPITLAYKLRQAGFVLPPRSHHRRKQRKKWFFDPAVAVVIFSVYKSVAQTARALGFPKNRGQNSVRHALRRAGVY